MATKKEPDGKHPSSHYLVVEDPDTVSTWHLRVKGIDGKPDHRLMGAAWAALHCGYRGNKYEGPQKQEAISKLKALYKSEGLDLPSEQQSAVSGQQSAGERLRAEGSGFNLDPSPFGTARFTVTLANVPSAGLARIPLAVTGTWVKGDRKFSITLEDLEAIAANFAKRELGEVNVDFEHASEMPEMAQGGPVPSAGRILRVEPPQAMPTTGGLNGHYMVWGSYEPTPRAKELIQNREYRYISPALDWSATDKKTGAAQGCTLTSVALTNRPFLEAMPEIHLSDAGFIDIGQAHVDQPLKVVSVAYQQPGGQKENQMATRFSMKKLTDGEHAGHHGIFDGDDLKGYVTDGDFQKHAGKFCNCDHSDRASEISTAAVQTFTETIGAKGKTAEEIKALVAAGTAPAKRTAAEMFSDLTTNGVFDRRKAARLTDQGKITHEDFVAADETGQAVEAAVKAGKVLPAQRAAAMKLALSDRAAFDELIGAAKPIVDTEVRGGVEVTANGGTASEEIEQLITVYLTEKKLDRKTHYREALSEVTAKNPELWKRACREGRGVTA